MPRGERRSPPRPVSSVPAAKPASSVAQPAPKQPGLFGQMASMAAGVAIGSTVGDAVSNVLFGGKGDESTKYERYDLRQQNQGPCQYELQQFVECAQNQGDVTMCQGLHETLKQCKLANNIS